MKKLLNFLTVQCIKPLDVLKLEINNKSYFVGDGLSLSELKELSHLKKIDTDFKSIGYLRTTSDNNITDSTLFNILLRYDILNNHKSVSKFEFIGEPLLISNPYGHTIAYKEIVIKDKYNSFTSTYKLQFKFDY